MFGCKARISLDIVFRTPTSEVTNPCEHAQTLRERLEECFKTVRENLGAAAERQKEYYNCRVHTRKETMSGYTTQQYQEDSQKAVVPLGRAI